MTNFKQKAKVGVAGSFFNQLMSNNSSIPEVGKGATEMSYTDRYAHEVIKVSEDKKTVRLEKLEARFDPAFGEPQMGHQNWIFEPTGNFFTVVWRHNAWRIKSEVIDFLPEWYDKAEKQNTNISKLLTDWQRSAVYDNSIHPKNVVEGLTKSKFKYHKINILFGRKDYHYDWSF